MCEELKDESVECLLKVKSIGKIMSVRSLERL